MTKFQSNLENLTKEISELRAINHQLVQDNALLLQALKNQSVRQSSSSHSFPTLARLFLILVVLEPYLLCSPHPLVVPKNHVAPNQNRGTPFCHPFLVSWNHLLLHFF